MKQYIRFLFPAGLLLVIICLSGCRKAPDPEAGFSESFYVSFNFRNENIKLEEGDVEATNYWSPGPVSGWHNHFDSGIRDFDIEFSIELDKRPVEQSDIYTIEGRNLALAGDTYPKVQLYLINNQGGQSFSTGVDPIDYGVSSCIVNQVIKGPKLM